MDVTIDDAVLDTWGRVMDGDAATAWVLVGYEGNDRLTVKASGAGGRADCLGSITSDSEIVFGGFRLTAVDNRGTVESRRSKFVFFLYRAPASSSMGKARAGRHLGSVEQAFHGHHVQFQIDELYEMSEAEIVRRLRSAGGAHQPTGYDFGAGDVGEGAEEAAPERAAAANPADAAVSNARAPVSAGAPPAAAAATPASAAAAEAPTAGGTDAAAPVVAAMAAASVSDGPTLVDGEELLLLVSSMPSTAVAEGNQTNVRQMFSAKGVAFTEIDGVDPKNKALRSEMFNLGKRGAYPQAFIRGPDGLRSVGDFEEIQSLNDTDTLPPDVLEANPQIPTLSKVLGKFMKK